MSSKNHDPSYNPSRGVLPPSNEEIALLEAALQRSGRPDDDLLVLMTWLAQTQRAQQWLDRVWAGEGALVVDGMHVRFIETATGAQRDGREE